MYAVKSVNGEWQEERLLDLDGAKMLGKLKFGDTGYIIGEVQQDNTIIALEDLVLELEDVTEWGEIEHPTLGKVMTYLPSGAMPYDSYTRPFVFNDGDMYCYRYDHDRGGWLEEPILLGEYDGVKSIYL